MIAYLEGSIFSFEEDRLVLLANQVGYEVILPASVAVALTEKAIGEVIALHIYHHQTERQPKPVLIGFLDAADKAFFQLFITVEAIGPMKAVKAMTRSAAEVAAAIENKDIAALTALSGIGKRTAKRSLRHSRARSISLPRCPSPTRLSHCRTRPAGKSIVFWWISWVTSPPRPVKWWPTH
jgi:Holliday junction DNA helicase RuvA